MTSNEMRDEIALQIKEIASSSILAEAVDKLTSLYNDALLLDAVSHYINDPTIQRREWIICIRLLCRLDKISANHAFSKILQTESDLDKRGRLIDHLAGCGTSVVVPQLMQIVREDPNPDIRFLAIVALRSIGDARAISVLRDAKANDKGVNYEGETIASQAKLALKQLQRNDK